MSYKLQNCSRELVVIDRVDTTAWRIGSDLLCKLYNLAQSVSTSRALQMLTATDSRCLPLIRLYDVEVSSQNRAARPGLGFQQLLQLSRMSCGLKTEK